MLTLAAVRFNPDLNAKYDQLLVAEKPARVALVATMRKLIVLANALLRDGRTWSEIQA
jgi:transposase